MPDWVDEYPEEFENWTILQPIYGHKNYFCNFCYKPMLGYSTKINNKIATVTCWQCDNSYEFEIMPHVGN